MKEFDGSALLLLARGFSPMRQDLNLIRVSLAIDGFDYTKMAISKPKWFV